MSENYKWVQNRKCEFFPCHKGVKEEDFNCLFCYCPLYMLKDKCGGNYKNTNGYKDCSDCILPHRRSGYDFVMKKMGMVMEVGKGTFVITDNGNVCTKAEDANDSSDVICSEAEKDNAKDNNKSISDDTEFKLKDVQEELEKQKDKK